MWPIGQFLDILVNNFSNKSSSYILAKFQAILNHTTFNDLATFGAILGKIGQLFIPSSGHTVCDKHKWWLVATFSLEPVGKSVDANQSIMFCSTDPKPTCISHREQTIFESDKHQKVDYWSWIVANSSERAVWPAWWIILQHLAFGHLHQWKFAQKNAKFVKVGYIFCQIVN